MTNSADAPNGELLSMEEAIERLKTTRPTFYRWLRSGKIKGMKLGRQWRFYPADIERFLQGEQPRVALATDIDPLLETLVEQLQEQGATEFFAELEGAERAVQLILHLAAHSRASDLHLEPIYLKQGQQQALLRQRQDGSLQTVALFDRRLLPPLIEQFKILSACDPHSADQAQEGQFSWEWSAHKQAFEMRSHFLPTALGEALTLRLLNKSLSENITLEKLDLNPAALNALQKALKRGWGLIITSGPTGSGKTTTLYAALNEVAAPEIKSLSLEDPVERYFPWVTSVALQAQQGQTFVQALRTLMQADPDVLMIGEIRDSESTQMALRIALTGHLVLTQLHAESALRALLRLIEVSGNPYAVSESVRLILNQRLVRRLCPHCAVRGPIDEAMQDKLEHLLVHTPYQSSDFQEVWHAQGCPECHGQGYRGRFQLTEALSLSPALSRLLHAGADESALEAELTRSGFQSFMADGLERAQNGDTSLEELVRVMGLS